MDDTKVALGIAVAAQNALASGEFQKRYPPKNDRMYDPADPFYLSSTDYLDQYNPNRLHCVDGGACHHACQTNESGENGCSRRNSCAPFSNSGWELKDGEWVHQVE